MNVEQALGAADDSKEIFRLQQENARLIRLLDIAASAIVDGYAEGYIDRSNWREIRRVLIEKAPNGESAAYLRTMFFGDENDPTPKEEVK